MKISQIAPACLLIAAIMVSCGGCGDDPVEPVDPPRIAEFIAQPADIMPGDSTLLSYRVVGADSLKLYPGDIRLTPTSTGDRYVHPTIPTQYGLVGYNEGGKDSSAVLITMAGAVASIEQFDISAERILIGDSFTLTWRTARADSIVLSEDQSRILSSSADSGQTVRSPNASRTYSAVAYNDIGNDTVSLFTTVEAPFAVSAIFGTLFKGSMGGGIQEPNFRFQIQDASAQPLRLPWLYFSIVEGDGHLSADSALPDANAGIGNDYIFDGQLGHAVIRAIVPDVDTLDVRARASVLRLGAGGQGQYVRFEDTYADVLALNGQPESLDQDPYDRPILYANYESSLGLVVAILDLDDNDQADAAEPVFEIFVNTTFALTTLDGIGIGSSIQELRAAYGPPDSSFVDPTPPAVDGLWYASSLGALIYVSHVAPDSAIVEIHLWEPIQPGGALSDTRIKTSSKTTDQETAFRTYRLR
jgi:hypothetical protein